MNGFYQNVNAPAQLSPAHFLWIRAFSQAPPNGDGVTALNRVPVFASIESEPFAKLHF